MLGAAAGVMPFVPDLPAVLVMVIAPVGIDRIRRLRGRPRTGGIAAISGIS
jgi:hypothetical protein